MATATKVKSVSGWTGQAALYKLDPPYEGEDHVIVSATVAPFTGGETYIFSATPEGEVKDWGAMPGSLRGTLSHAEVLESAGYEVVRA